MNSIEGDEVGVGIEDTGLIIKFGWLDERVITRADWLRCKDEIINSIESLLKIRNCDLVTRWVCPECNNVTNWTMRDVADKGTPYCDNRTSEVIEGEVSECGCEMKLDESY